MMLPFTVVTGPVHKIIIKKLGISECMLKLTQDDILNPTSVLEWIKTSGCAVLAVHSPNLVTLDHTYIEDYLYFKTFFHSLFECVNQIGEYYNRAMPLIMHTRLTYECTDTVQTIACCLEQVLDNYPFVKLCIENGVFRFSVEKPFSNIPSNIPVIVDEFNEWMPNHPVSASLNVAHAIDTIRVCETLINAGIQDTSAPTLEQYAKCYGSRCRVYQISQAVKYGEIRSESGIGFGDSDASINKLKYYLELHEQEFPNAIAVMSVSDTDICNFPNLKRTFNTLKEYF